MNSLLFLGVLAGVMLLAAMQNNAKLHRVLQTHSQTIRLLPQVVSMLILSAQISELLRVVEHVSIANVVAALLLLAMVVATKSGTGNEFG